MSRATHPISREAILREINAQINNSINERWRKCRAVEIGNRPGFDHRHILWVTRFEGDCTQFCMDEINEQVVSPLSQRYHLQPL